MKRGFQNQDQKEDSFKLEKLKIKFVVPDEEFPHKLLLAGIMSSRRASSNHTKDANDPLEATIMAENTKS